MFVEGGCTMRYLMIFFTLLGCLAQHAANAQGDLGNVCKVEGGNLIFTLDRRWTSEQRAELARTYDLDSAVIVAAFAAKPVFEVNGVTWKTHILEDHRIELAKIADQSGPSQERIILLDDDLVEIEAETERSSVAYGVNRLTRITVVSLGETRMRFYLPGYTSSRKVFLSGSFNGWSTMQTPMVRSDSGWSVTLRLLPGKYTYKYIIDGKWTSDPFNRLREDDTKSGYNSVCYSYNYRFVLPGFEQAKKVFVAGSFNNWNEEELRMIFYKGKWILNLFLREGTHAYKFIVDGKWITDPANPVTRPDGTGNKNSFIGIGDTLYFRLAGNLSAKKVVVAGNFNGWNTEELGMKKTATGWELPYVLGAGNYEYKFIVDGKWMTDPANPYTTGSGGYLNSFMAVKPNHTFVLKGHSDSKTVIVTGSFNGWDTGGYRMKYLNFQWSFPLYLKPGKCTYKFIIDRKWILDPDNELWEDNEYGTGNSVIWISP